MKRFFVCVILVANAVLFAACSKSPSEADSPIATMSNSLPASLVAAHTYLVTFDLTGAASLDASGDAEVIIEMNFWSTFKDWGVQSFIGYEAFPLLSASGGLRQLTTPTPVIYFRAHQFGPGSHIGGVVQFNTLNTPVLGPILLPLTLTVHSATGIHTQQWTVRAVVVTN